MGRVNFGREQRRAFYAAGNWREAVFTGGDSLLTSPKLLLRGPTVLVAVPKATGTKPYLPSGHRAYMLLATGERP